MPRKVSFVSEAVWYVPNVGDNREDKDPFRVLIEPMSGRELKQLERSQNRKIFGSRKPNRNAAAALMDDYTESISREIITSRVKQVWGYSVTGQRGTVTPTNGSDLFGAIYDDDAPGEELDVIDDIIAAIKDHSVLSEGLLGKSDRPSASSAAGIAPSNGAADAAAEKMEIQGSTGNNSEGPVTATGTLTRPSP